MTSVIVQPCSSPVSQQHYADTIARPVMFSSYATLISPHDLVRLKELFPGGAAAMWGVVPGERDANVGRYQRMQAGDVALFSRQGSFFSCGTVALLLRSAALAEALWGRDTKGRTWEYMYVLDEVRPVQIPYPEFNNAVGYKPSFVPQGFDVLREQQSLAALDHFPLSSERHVPGPSAEEYAAAVADLSAAAGLDANRDLDRRVQASQRTEQAYLRKLLFPGPQGRCDLCGREFETEFLVAAHIKKRAACTDAEKRDARHIVMAACKFGCDELFERGYVGVAADGAIVMSQVLRPGSQAHAYWHSFLDGNSLRRQMAGRESYFDWHRTRTFRG